MKTQSLFAVVFGLALSATFAQNAPPPPTQDPGPAGSQGQQRGWRGGIMGGPGMAGHGVAGTVLQAAPDHFAIKTEAGEVYIAHFSVNTRILKQRVTRGNPGEEGNGGPPQMLKATDIKVGDAIAAIGEVDNATKSVGAMTIVQIDPERAKQMREMQTNYGKTWLMGKVTAVEGVKVTVQGGPDNVERTFVADEITTFRKRREPITLADLQVGDAIRVEGAVKEGSFVATAVVVMGPRNVTMPRQPNAPTGASPQLQ